MNPQIEQLTKIDGVLLTPKAIAQLKNLQDENNSLIKYVQDISFELIKYISESEPSPEFEKSQLALIKKITFLQTIINELAKP